MRLSFECSEPVAVLSRVLDQVRRLGIGLLHLSATEDRAAFLVVLETEAIAPTVAQTLFDRIALIGGVKKLRRDHAVTSKSNGSQSCYERN